MHFDLYLGHVSCSYDQHRIFSPLFPYVFSFLPLGSFFPEPPFPSFLSPLQNLHAQFSFLSFPSLSLPLFSQRKKKQRNKKTKKQKNKKTKKQKNKKTKKQKKNKKTKKQKKNKKTKKKQKTCTIFFGGAQGLLKKKRKGNRVAKSKKREALGGARTRDH